MLCFGVLLKMFLQKLGLPMLSCAQDGPLHNILCLKLSRAFAILCDLCESCTSEKDQIAKTK